MTSIPVVSGRDWYSNFSRVFSITVFGIALAGGLGWLVGDLRLAGEWVLFIPMAPSTALCFLLMGAVSFRLTHKPFEPPLCGFVLGGAGVCALFSLLVLARAFAGPDLVTGIERALSGTTATLNQIPIGRMSPITAAILLSQTIVIFCLEHESCRVLRPPVAATLSIGGVLVSVLMVMGYASSMPLFYTGAFVPPALPSALAFLFLTTALSLIAAPRVRYLQSWGPATFRGRLFFAFLPVTMLIFLVHDGMDLWLASHLSVHPVVWTFFSSVAAGGILALVIVLMARRVGRIIASGQKALLESEAMLKRSQQIALLGHYVFSVNDGTWTSSAMLDEVFGVPPDYQKDVAGWMHCIHPDHRAEMQEYLAHEVLRGQKRFDREYKIVRQRDGATRWVHGYGNLEFDAGGQPVKMFGVIQDITERKMAVEAVAAERERLAVTLRSIGDGVITTDTQGNVVLLNKVAEELTGWTQAEAQGKPIATVFNIIHERTRKPHDNPVDRVLASGAIIELANHTVLVARDGTERVIADSGAPIKNARSETIGAVLVFRDTTEKQKLLANMMRIDKLDALGVLSSGIAHDFNNLLSGIFGYIDIAREGCGAESREALDKALAVYNRAKELTQQFLTFSKGGAPKRRTGQLGKLIRENAEFALSGSNVRCDYLLDPDLWLSEFDESQIDQVIDNIVLNAKQAMPTGGHITLSAGNVVLKTGEVPLLQAGNYVRISIADRGSGIPRHLLGRIFDPFFTTKPMGNGLGLTTCYSIMQKHDGAIEVESDPGKGTTFHLYLPASHGELTEAAAVPRMPPQGCGRVLIMDDEPFMREILDHMLAALGYSCLTAQDGDEALRLQAAAMEKGETIVAAILDLTIPGGKGGVKTVVALRSRMPELPIFAASGFSEDPAIANPDAFGFSDSIRKPFTMKELAALLTKHLRSTTEQPVTP